MRSPGSGRHTRQSFVFPTDPRPKLSRMRLERVSEVRRCVHPRKDRFTLRIQAVRNEHDHHRFRQCCWRNSTLKTYKGFPHSMPTTEADTINADLLTFLKAYP